MATGVNVDASAGSVAIINSGVITGSNAIALGSDNNTLLNSGILNTTGNNAI